MNSIPEDYDDDDYHQPGYLPYHSNTSLPDTIYEDKSKITLAGLRQTSLSQIGEKKRFRPPTVLNPMAQQQQQQQPAPPQFAQPHMRAPRSPSMSSFQTTSSGDRSSMQQYAPPHHHHHHHHHQQQQQQQQYQYQPQQQQFRLQQNPYLPQQPQYFQAPIHYGQQQLRSGNSLLSPASSNIYLSQPPKRYTNQSVDSLTPSSSFEQENELPITPESMEELNDTRHTSLIMELNNKNETLTKENDTLNEKLGKLEKLLNDKEQELQLKNNIIDAKTKQLTLREEKLTNKERQIEILNKKISSGGSDEGTVLKLEKTNKDLSTKILTLLEEIEILKTTEHDKLAKVNKDLSLKIVSLLEEIELLRTKQQIIDSPMLSKSTRSQHSARFPQGDKTIKDLSKEELFKSEFLNILEILNQNQSYYENKIKNLQDTVEDHKKLIKNISNIKKNLNSNDTKRSGFKIIDIVPATL